MIYLRKEFKNIFMHGKIVVTFALPRVKASLHRYLLEFLRKTAVAGTGSSTAGSTQEGIFDANMLRYHSKCKKTNGDSGTSNGI